MGFIKNRIQKFRVNKFYATPTLEKKLTSVAVAAFIVTLVFAANTMAAQDDVNIPIMSPQAFDAVVKQVDPATGENMRIALIDLRTTEEYFWVGACGTAESITTISGKEFFPHNGKVVMKNENVTIERC